MPFGTENISCSTSGTRGVTLDKIHPDPYIYCSVTCFRGLGVNETFLDFSFRRFDTS